ncbi:MAG TPA: terminase family protein [Gaiellaceae bacterium]|nr:terminase family protein [Gaiellaceae bacterium]
MSASIAVRLGQLELERRRRVLNEISPFDARRLLYAWRFWARPEQVEPPGEWRTWVIDAGRGFGKTRSGAEWVRERIEYHGARSIAFIAATYKDLRDTMLGEGKTDPGEGFLNVWPPEQRPIWKEQKHRIVLVDANGRERNDVNITVHTAEDAQYRGPNLDTCWCDEVCKWPYPEDLWNNLQMTLRRPGSNPRVAVTTTPNEEVPLLEEIESEPDTVVTRGTTFDNAANVDPAWIATMVRKYGGTPLGLQELFAQVSKSKRMFRKAMIEANRASAPAKFRRCAIGVDPGVSQSRGSDMTGIVGGGEANGILYVTDDRTAVYSAQEWAIAVLEAFWELDRLEPEQGTWIVVERNKGGDLVRANLEGVIRIIELGAPEFAALRTRMGASLRRAMHAIVEVHAFDGKQTRATPVAAAAERNQIKFCGKFPLLEKQLVSFNPLISSMANKDAFDGFVHLAWHLLRLERDDVEHVPYDAEWVAANDEINRDRKRGDASDLDARFSEDEDEERDAGGLMGWGGTI